MNFIMLFYSVNSVVLFPKIPDALKSSTGNEAYNDNGLVPRSIRLLKDKFPDLDMYDNLSQKIEDVMTAKAIPFPLDGEYTSFLNTG
ncbi:hypothetical protein Ahy_B03g064657 [Arachis hypogaea]|uniref:Uncharacterized protein n=1 Tax=Arachis hypogaea TaxID=3818 RepID=A0A445A025_ARAHY|nr:hypothetical protein Ahy_B03g064657 [Arachis hypogaea]